MEILDSNIRDIKLPEIRLICYNSLELSPQVKSYLYETSLVSLANVVHTKLQPKK